MDLHEHKKNPAVRVPPLTALAVFALMAGLCAMTVFLVLGDIEPLILVLVVVAAIIAAVLGMLIVPRVLYTNAITAMFIGALVALLSHFLSRSCGRWEGLCSILRLRSVNFRRTSQSY